jgi:hypothetical protein
MEILSSHCKFANEDAKSSCEKQFAQWFILLQKTLEYQNAMSISYGQQQVLHYFLMCNGLNLGRDYTITNTLIPIIKQCV